MIPLNEYQKTALYEEHVKVKASMVEFAGWIMPIKYRNIVDEHLVVRRTAGLFDISHMGELKISGSLAFEFIQKVTTNNIGKLQVKRALYSLICNPQGGIIDDIIIYQLGAYEYMFVVNAANKDKVLKWLCDQRNKAENKSDVLSIQDVSAELCLLALQGPKAEEILAQVTDLEVNKIKYFHYDEGKIAGEKAILSRTGYTGEAGFEIFVQADKVVAVWRKLLEVGRPAGLEPVGLGARDTLRFEASLSLYGQELKEDTTPFEAGLTKFVDMTKDSFIGRAALERSREQGVKRKLVGFRMVDRGIPRIGYQLEAEGEIIGEVTSGTFCPYLKYNAGMGYVRTDCAYTEKEINVLIRGKKLKAKIIKKPFYQRGDRR